MVKKMFFKMLKSTKIVIYAAILIICAFTVFGADSTNPADYYFFDDLETPATFPTNYINDGKLSNDTTSSYEGNVNLKLANEGATVSCNNYINLSKVSKATEPYCMDYQMWYGTGAASNAEMGFFWNSWAGGTPAIINYNSASPSDVLTFLASGWTSIGSNFGVSTWGRITVCYDQGNASSGTTTARVYRNGVSIYNESGVNRLGLNKMCFHNRLPTSGVARYDNIRMWNYTKYGPTAPQAAPTVNNITFIARFPTDITNTNIFQITPVYNYSYNLSGLTNAYAISYLSTSIDCTMRTNGTCTILNGTNRTTTSFQNVSAGGFANYSFNFTENQVYPITENINSSTINSVGVFNTTFTGSNNYFSDEIPGIINTTKYNIYEVPILSTGTVSVYYYNSSYAFSNSPEGNSNVHEFCTLINPSTFNHSHGLYGHNICPYTFNDTGYLGTVKFNGGGFIVRGNIQGVTIILANKTIRDNAAQFTTNNGNSWSNVVGVVASHVHNFNANDTFCARAEGNYTGVRQNTTFICDTLDITPFPPEIPSVIVPDGSVSYGRFVNLTWEQSIPNYQGSYITLYNITLHNSDFSLNTTISTTNNATYTYNWDTFGYNLNLSNQYLLRVEAVDSGNLRSVSFSEPFNVTSDAEINIYARNIFGNTSITNATNYTIIGGGLTLTSNNTNGNVTFNIIKNQAYNITVRPEGFAQNNFSLNINTTTTNLYSMHYRKNTINFTFFDENTKLKINNVQIELIGTVNQYNYSTTTGTVLAELLSPETYSTISTSNGYFPRSNIITVGDFSYQEQSIFLLNNSVTTNIQTLITVTDRANNPLIGATVTIELLQGTSFITVQSRETDFSGSVSLVLDSSKIYRITAWKSGYYQTQTQIQPSQSSYTIRIDRIAPVDNINIYSRAAFSFTPVNTTINQSQNTFTFVTTAVNGTFSFFGIEANGQKDNRTSPTGGTATITLDLSAYNNRPLTIRYFYLFSDGSNANFNRTYYVTNSSISQDSIIGITERLNIGTGGKILFGIAVVILGLVSLAVFLPPGALAFVAVGLFILMWGIGLFPAYLSALFILIMIFGLIIKER
jgi:hypothetical protein